MLIQPMSKIFSSGIPEKQTDLDRNTYQSTDEYHRYCGAAASQKKPVHCFVSTILLLLLTCKTRLTLVQILSCILSTKYLGGHSDVIQGALVMNDQTLRDQLYFIQKSCGAVPGRWIAFLCCGVLKHCMCA